MIRGSSKTSRRPTLQQASCKIVFDFVKESFLFFSPPDDEGNPPALALDGAEACLGVDEGLLAAAGDPHAGPDEDTGAVVAVVGLDTLGEVGRRFEDREGGEVEVVGGVDQQPLHWQGQGHLDHTLQEEVEEHVVPHAFATFCEQIIFVAMI